MECQRSSAATSVVRWFLLLLYIDGTATKIGTTILRGQMMTLTVVSNGQWTNTSRLATRDETTLPFTASRLWMIWSTTSIPKRSKPKTSSLNLLETSLQVSCTHGTVKQWSQSTAGRWLPSTRWSQILHRRKIPSFRSMNILGRPFPFLRSVWKSSEGWSSCWWSLRPQLSSTCFEILTKNTRQSLKCCSNIKALKTAKAWLEWLP